MDTSSFITLIFFIGVFSGGQHFEVPPKGFFKIGSLKTSTKYSTSILSNSSDGTNNSIKLSNLPTLSRKAIISPKNLFDTETTTGIPRTTSTQRHTSLNQHTIQSTVKPKTSTEAIAISTLRSNQLKNMCETKSSERAQLVTNDDITSTTPKIEMTSVNPKTVSTEPPEYMSSSTISATYDETTTEKIVKAEMEINSLPWNVTKHDSTTKRTTDAWIFEIYNNNNSPGVHESNNTTSTEITTTYHGPTKTTISSTDTHPTPPKRRNFKNPILHLNTPGRISKMSSPSSSSPPKFSFALTAKQIRISNLMKNSKLPLVAIGRKFYHVQTDIKANFLGAFHFCRKHRMDLLSIESRAEEEAIANFLNESKISEVWTSGTDLAEEGKFVWLSTGKVFDYVAWGPNQPDNAGSIEDCVQIIFRPLFSDNFSWEDVFCDLPSYFICEVSSCTDFCMNE